MDDSQRADQPADTDATLVTLQRSAFAFTVGAAVLAGIVWLYTVIVDENPEWTDTTSGFLVGVVFIGGICMALLHLAGIIRGRRAD